MAMGDIELREGNIITARSFDHDEDGSDGDTAQFDVRILSNAVVERGMSSILKGEVQLERCGPGDESRLEVAVKVVRRTRDQETARQRLQRELQAVQHARHRFIVPFFGAAEFRDLLLIISPFMTNGNLLQYLRLNPSANRQLLLLQVADAVCYLHTVAGMVHGDLKCENVLISPEGNALLTDFGLSTLIDKPASDSTTTTSITQLYTLRFAAPEVLQDEAKSSTGRVRSKTTETDVYTRNLAETIQFEFKAFTGGIQRRRRRETGPEPRIRPQPPRRRGHGAGPHRRVVGAMPVLLELRPRRET